MCFHTRMHDENIQWSNEIFFHHQEEGCTEIQTYLRFTTFIWLENKFVVALFCCQIYSIYVFVKKKMKHRSYWIFYFDKKNIKPKISFFIIYIDLSEPLPLSMIYGPTLNFISETKCVQKMHRKTSKVR